MNPKSYFIIDYLGALISSCMIGIVLVRYESFFGIPSEILYWLAAFPILFAIYDLMCYFFASDHISRWLKGIAVMNISYCIFSIIAAYYHAQSITIYGWLYIILEVIIVIYIAYREWRAST